MSTPVRSPAPVVRWPNRDRRIVPIPADMYDTLADLARQLGEPVEAYVEGILDAHLQWVSKRTVRNEARQV